MYYVYSRHLASGREGYVGAYKSEKEAVLKIAQCYAIDARTYAAGEYYYFMKKH